MNAIIPIDEVFTAYPDTWVLLDELVSHDNLSVQAGKVVGNAPDLPGVTAMAVEMQLARCVVVCTKLKDGKPAVSRDYAVSTITSFEEMQTVMANAV